LWIESINDIWLTQGSRIQHAILASNPLPGHSREEGEWVFGLSEEGDIGEIEFFTGPVPNVLEEELKTLEGHRLTIGIVRRITGSKELDPWSSQYFKFMASKFRENIILSALCCLFRVKRAYKSPDQQTKRHLLQCTATISGVAKIIYEVTYSSVEVSSVLPKLSDLCGYPVTGMEVATLTNSRNIRTLEPFLLIWKVAHSGSKPSSAPGFLGALRRAQVTANRKGFLFRGYGLALDDLQIATNEAEKLATVVHMGATRWNTAERYGTTPAPRREATSNVVARSLALGGAKTTTPQINLLSDSERVKEELSDVADPFAVSRSSGEKSVVSGRERTLDEGASKPTPATSLSRGRAEKKGEIDRQLEAGTIAKGETFKHLSYNMKAIAKIRFTPESVSNFLSTHWTPDPNLKELSTIYIDFAGNKLVDSKGKGFGITKKPDNTYGIWVLNET
jgi:hypothetical protein